MFHMEMRSRNTLVIIIVIIIIIIIIIILVVVIIIIGHRKRNPGAKDHELSKLLRVIWLVGRLS